MKINVHNSTYIFVLICFLSGYFEYIFLLLLIIFIHECGHYFFSLICGINVKKIIIYPLGGITLLDCPLNISIFKEFISLIGGIIFQLIFWLLIYILYNNELITNHVYILINNINLFLISFNFLPILPLDGGRLLNIILDRFFSYLDSYKISIYISFIFCLTYLILSFSVFSIIIFLILINKLIYEYKNIYIRYNLFLYERYNYNFNFKNIKYINNINKMYRDYYHFINGEEEKVVLSKKFSRNY